MCIGIGARPCFGSLMHVAKGKEESKEESKDGFGTVWVKGIMLAFCDSGFASESSL